MPPTFEPPAGYELDGNSGSPAGGMPTFKPPAGYEMDGKSDNIPRGKEAKDLTKRVEEKVAHNEAVDVKQTSNVPAFYGIGGIVTADVGFCALTIIMAGAFTISYIRKKWVSFLFPFSSQYTSLAGRWWHRLMEVLFVLILTSVTIITLVVLALSFNSGTANGLNSISRAVPLLFTISWVIQLLYYKGVIYIIYGKEYSERGRESK